MEESELKDILLELGFSTNNGSHNYTLYSNSKKTLIQFDFKLGAIDFIYHKMEPQPHSEYKHYSIDYDKVVTSIYFFGIDIDYFEYIYNKSDIIKFFAVNGFNKFILDSRANKMNKI